MTARWIPPEERSSFIARSMFGTSIGTVITFPFCGAIVSALGWEPAFYIIGSITIVWFIAWCFLVYDDPVHHPFISKTEREAIKEALGQDFDSSKDRSVPWKAILTSIPFMGLMITDSGNTWGLWTLSTNGPTYMKYILGVDIKMNGVLSGLPFLCRYIGGLVFSSIADWLQRKKYLSVIWIRRIFNSVSQCGPAFAMLMLAFSPTQLRCNVTYSICLLCIGKFLNGAISSGHFSSFIDLAPNFAGTLFGISNTFSGGATGFLVPAVIGAITNNNMNLSAWMLVFGLAAAIHIIGNTIYILTIKAEVQKWNYPGES